MHPEEQNTVAWFERSAKPTNDGAVLLYMQYPMPGIESFASKTLELIKNDEVVVTLASGQEVSYVVADTKSFAYDSLDLAEILDVYKKNDAGLNILVKSEQQGQDHKLFYAIKQ